MSDAHLRNRIADYLSNPTAEFVDIAREHNALPVYSDMGGTLFLTSAGKVLCLPDGGELSEEHSPEWQLIAALCAAEKFPELQYLVPPRPGHAADCEQCSGQRRVMNGFRCGSCLGLGWRA